MSLARRDFLKLGSVAVAGLGLPSSAFAVLGHLPAKLLSAGYAPAEPEENAIVWLTPASKLLSGDIAFLSRDVQVTIRSSFAVKTHGPNARIAAIDVAFPATGYQPDAYPTYRAYQRAKESSGPVSFRVPVEATTGLQLLFTRVNPDADASQQQQAEDMVQLSLNSTSADPKLQRGIYVIAYGEPAVANWSAVPITRQGREIVVPNAKFSYVVISIDYAG